MAEDRPREGVQTALGGAWPRKVGQTGSVVNGDMCTDSIYPGGASLCARFRPNHSMASLPGCITRDRESRGFVDRRTAAGAMSDGELGPRARTEALPGAEPTERAKSNAATCTSESSATHVTNGIVAVLPNNKRVKNFSLLQKRTSLAEELQAHHPASVDQLVSRRLAATHAA